MDQAGVTSSRFEANGVLMKSVLQNELYGDQSKRKTTVFKHQLEAVFKCDDFFQQTRKIPALIVAPTGAGKTGIICMLPYILKSKKVLILSPSLKITEQLNSAFGQERLNVQESFLYKTGITCFNDQLTRQVLEPAYVIRNTVEPMNMSTHNLVIVNAQKFSGNTRASLRVPVPDPLSEDGEMPDNEVVEQRIETIKQNFAEFSTLIVDEAHHYPAETWDLIVQNFESKQVIFLTATPYRGREGIQLLPNQAITYQIHIRELIALNILRPLEFQLFPEAMFNNNGNQTPNKEQYQAMANYILQILRNHDEQSAAAQPDLIVRHKAMVLVSRVQETEEATRAIGPLATCYTSESGSSSNLRLFENSLNSPRILFVCGRLLEGYDNSDVSVCVVLRKVGAPGLFTQFVGRCIRTSWKDKPDPITAVVVSHSKFQQEQMFMKYLEMMQ